MQFHRTTLWTQEKTACRETSTKQNVIAKQILEQPETFKITGRNCPTLQPPDVYNTEEDIKYITKKQLPRAQEKVKSLTVHDRNSTYHQAESRDKSYFLLELWPLSQTLQGVEPVSELISVRTSAKFCSEAPGLMFDSPLCAEQTMCQRLFQTINEDLFPLMEMEQNLILQVTAIMILYSCL